MLALMHQAQAPWLRPGGVSGTGADHLLPALVLRGPGRDRRASSSARCPGPRHAAAVRRRARTGHRLLPGLCRTGAGRRPHAPLQHRDHGRQDAGSIVGKYRKIHLPGHAEHEPWRAFQHLEKRYFEIGNLGFNVFRAFGGILGMAICNDRRWPETYRVMGLQGVEMILIGYNTPVHNPPAPEHDALVALPQRAGDAVRRLPERQLGRRRGQGRQRGRRARRSATRSSSRRRARSSRACSTLGDELAIARCDLDLTLSYKNTTFNFAKHREPQAYGLIVERKGAVPPPL